MAQVLPMSSSHPVPRLRDTPSRIRSVSPIPSQSSTTSTSRSTSSPRPQHTTVKPTPTKKRTNGPSKENVPMADGEELAFDQASLLARAKAASGGGGGVFVDESIGMGNGGGRTWRDGSVEVDDTPIDVIRARKSSAPRSVRSSKSPASTQSSPYNGLPTLPTVPDADAEPGSPAMEASRPPPPAASTLTGMGRPVTRKRRSSSVKRKLSPGVKPTKAVDWEIPRKSLHSSIGFLTLYLNYLDPPSLLHLIVFLCTGLISVTITDILRLNFPAFAEVWELYFGFLMRESERKQINGVIWYLVGVIFVLGLYPRDVAVVSILTLSWSDTTASTIGRLWGRHTPPLPSHFPGIKSLKFAPRKSLAGFLAATATGVLLCLGFWWRGSHGRWAILDGHWSGLLVTALIVGVGGAISEALDLGLDDNLTLPILSGAIVWIWLSATNLLF